MGSKAPYLSLARLCEAVEKSRQAMQPFREQRHYAVTQGAGHRYSRNGAKKRLYVNLISLFQNIVGRKLISNHPKVMYSTFDQASQPAVAAMQDWANEEIVRLNLAAAFGRIAVDGLYAAGFCKTAIATPADSARSGMASGQPFVSRIDLDDFVYDVSVRDLEEAAHMGYMGNRFRAHLSVIRESPYYDKRAVKSLEASLDRATNEQGDDKISTVGGRHYSWDVEAEDMVDLWEIYYPRHKCIYTFTADQIGSAAYSRFGTDIIPLREQKWIGPEEGPYDWCAFDLVSGNPFPVGPISHVIDLHEAFNMCYRKLVAQARDCKEMLLYPETRMEEAERVAKTNDRGMCGVSNPKDWQTVTMNPISQGLMVMAKQLMQDFSWACGNLETMGGLAPQAHTLGQEELLQQQSSGQVAAMQDIMVAFVQKVFGKLNWFWWHHPTNVMRSKFEVEGASIVRQVHPWDHPDPTALRRNGEMPSVRVDPYSMRAQTPQQKAQQLDAFVQGVYMPMAQLFMQNGHFLDLNEYINMKSKFQDLPELKTVVKMQEPMPQEGGTAEPTGPTAPQGQQQPGPRAPRQDTGLDDPQNKEMMNTLLAGANAESNGRAGGQMNGQYR